MAETVLYPPDCGGGGIVYGTKALSFVKDGFETILVTGAYMKVSRDIYDPKILEGNTLHEGDLIMITFVKTCSHGGFGNLPAETELPRRLVIPGAPAGTYRPASGDSLDRKIGLESGTTSGHEFRTNVDLVDDGGSLYSFKTDKPPSSYENLPWEEFHVDSNGVADISKMVSLDHGGTTIRVAFYVRTGA